ncbi:MAG: hypothetical protein LQ351_004518 [Letrouitia transgressa]|nr:MAG: hypothetical protein LQ351_004518 [Letrouitia transgressa]
MIIRQALLRHEAGRRIVPPLRRSWVRRLASEVDSISASLDQSLAELDSIEPLASKNTPDATTKIDHSTLATANPHDDSVVEDYLTVKRQQQLTSHLGTSITSAYQPSALLSNPPSPADITLELLLASQSHLGHSTSLWNPANSRYIFGIRAGIHIISLDVTAAHLRRACRVVSGVAERAGVILFAGTRKGQDRCVVNAARLAGGCHLFERWTPGAITNGHQILGRCRMKVVNALDQEIPGYERQLLDRPVVKPDLVVCLNPLENYILLHECGLNGIPTVGIIDTDADPTWVTYPIPANDDSLRCVQVIAGVLGKAGEEGQKRRRERTLAGEITYTPEKLEEPDVALTDTNGVEPEETEEAEQAAEDGDEHDNIYIPRDHV